MTNFLLISLGLIGLLRGYPHYKRWQIGRDKTNAYKRYKNQFNKPKTD